MRALGMAALACLAALAGAQTSTFQIDSARLSFQYPSAWQLKRERVLSTFTIPLSGGRTARADVFSSEFRETPETWQEVQARVNETLKRTVVRQWQEEILGVPMLMTRLAYTEGGEETETLVGLLYSATPTKFHFRLTSPAAVSREAEEAWRGAMLTLRSLTGSLPAPEDPTRPVEPEKKPEPKPRETRVMTLRERNRGARPYRAPQALTLPALQRQVRVFVPKGWTLDNSGEKPVLKHPRMSSGIEFEVLAGPPREAEAVMLSRSAAAFSDFVSVALREEPRPVFSRSGLQVARIWRRGEGKEGPLVVWHAIGAGTTEFWSMAYRGTVAQFERDRRLMDELVDQLGIEIPELEPAQASPASPSP